MKKSVMICYRIDRELDEFRKEWHRQICVLAHKPRINYSAQCRCLLRLAKNNEDFRERVAKAVADNLAKYY